MSDRTLPDELRSVLLSHSLDAPAPEDTIARTLAEALESDQATPTPSRPWWRKTTAVLVAAVVAGVLAVGGTGLVLSARRDHSTSSSRAAGLASGEAGSSRPDLAPAQGMGPQLMHPTPNGAGNPVPMNLSCATGPGAKSVIAYQATVQLDGGLTDQVLGAQCADNTGQRDSSQVYTVHTVNGVAVIRTTVLRQSDGISVTGMSGGSHGFTVTYLRLATADTPEVLEQKTFGTIDEGASYPKVDTKILAPACAPSTLDATLTTGSNGDNRVLRVRNTGAEACEINGYPGVAGAVRTLNADNREGLVPLVVLQPGETASAGFGPSKSGVRCPMSRAPSSITLPTRQPLSAVKIQASLACPGTVHPFVNGAG